MSDIQICKNCNTELIGTYCSNCGQKDSEIKKIREFLSEFFDAFFSFDFRIFATLKYLLFKPGFLTREYWDGKKERYLSPLRLYLVVSFFTFVLMPFIAGLYSDSKGTLFTTSKNQEIPEGYSEMGFWGWKKSIEDIEIQYQNGDFTEEEYKQLVQLPTLIKKGMDISFERRITVGSILTKYAPMAMFMLMPFFAVILYLLLYRKKNLFYAHHLIAGLHLHSFMFLHLCFLVMLWHLPKAATWIDPISPFIITLPPIIYFIIFFKNVYENSWIKTILKSIFLGPLYLVLIAIMTIILFMVMLIYLSDNPTF